MADSQFSNVVLLLPCDGIDASTAIIDTSLSAHSLTVEGGAQISTTQSKYGGSSVGLTSGDAYISTPASADFNFGTGDFTIEFFAWKSADGVDGYDTVMSCDPTHAGAMGPGTGGWMVSLSNNIGFEFNSADATGALNGTYVALNPRDSTWHHWAICRSAGTTRFFKDGVVLTSYPDTLDMSASSGLTVGAFDDGTYPFNGYLDNLRITKGTARYTADFTPPAEDDFTGVEAGTATADLTLPMMALVADFGASFDGVIPALTLAADFGATIDGSIPMMTLDALVMGESLLTADLSIPMLAMDALVVPGDTLAADLLLPMMTLSASGHDATGENSLQGIIPMMTLQADCGAVMAGRILMMTMDAAMTGVALISVELSIPVMTLDAAGKGSPYIVTADLRIPMMMLQSDGGAGASLALPMMTLGASMTSGGLLTADLRIPMMALDAGMTRQGTVWADLTIPMMVPMASITADLSIPMMALDASITAVVTVNYEAYSINLSHAPGNPAPVDEVTRYTNFPFTHIVRYQGSYFGVAADGLYQLGGATDDGTTIPYAIKTCLDDFKAPELKTVASAFLVGRLGPDVTVSLHAGEDDAESYDFNTLRGTAARNHREKFGRGVKSRYFALGLAGEDALALDSIELEINKLKRRT